MKMEFREGLLFTSVQISFRGNTKVVEILWSIPERQKPLYPLRWSRISASLQNMRIA